MDGQPNAVQDSEPPPPDPRESRGSTVFLPGLKWVLRNFSHSSLGTEPWMVCSRCFFSSAILIFPSSFRFGYAARRRVYVPFQAAGTGGDFRLSELSVERESEGARRENSSEEMWFQVL